MLKAVLWSGWPRDYHSLLLFRSYLGCCSGISGHVLKQSSGTNPGQEPEIQDCPGDSGTVGNYNIM